RLFKEYVLASFEAVPRDREMIALGRGADIDDEDVRVLDDLLIVERRGRGLGERLHFGVPLGSDLADVQPNDGRRARQRLRADAAAPAGPDHPGFDLFHDVLRSFPAW